MVLYMSWLRRAVDFTVMLRTRHFCQIFAVLGTAPCLGLIGCQQHQRHLPCGLLISGTYGVCSPCCPMQQQQCQHCPNQQQPSSPLLAGCVWDRPLLLTAGCEPGASTWEMPPFCSAAAAAAVEAVGSEPWPGQCGAWSVLPSSGKSSSSSSASASSIDRCTSPRKRRAPVASARTVLS